MLLWENGSSHAGSFDAEQPGRLIKIKVPRLKFKPFLSEHVYYLVYYLMWIDLQLGAGSHLTEF